MSEASTADGLRGAVFLDRDGVLNEDLGYVGQIERFRWIPGAQEAIRSVNRRGYLAFVITNQSGVARNLFGEDDVRAVHAHMQAELGAIGAWIDDFRYCPHHPEAPNPHYRVRCACRKPGPGMILDLLRTWPVDPERAILVGDAPRDVEAARAAGLPGRLIAKGEDLLEVLAPFLGG